MKATKFIYTALAASLLAFMPFNFAAAEEVADTTRTDTVTVNHKKIIYNRGGKGNGRPITAQEKEVAKKMAKQGAQMGSKAAKLALTAITNPSKADSLQKEIERMGEEMERLGDSLESLSEDTTFFYEGEDSDTVVLSDEDFEDIAEEFGKNWDFHIGWPGGILGGILGAFGGILGIMIAIFVVLLLFGIFTAPLWILALIIWLAVRANRKNSAAPQVQQTTSTGQPLRTAQTATATGQAAQTAQATAQTAQPHTAQPHTAAPVTNTPQGLSDENQEMWKNGIMVTCVGLGLIVLFLSVGMKGFWGIGALVAIIGVAKLIIATTTKGKDNKSGTTSTPSEIITDSNYEK